jgi:hypothetical protein
VHHIRNTILLAAGLLGAGVPGVASTAAQTYDPRHSVCFEIYTIDGRSIDCSFATSRSAPRPLPGNLPSATPILIPCRAGS